MSEVLAILMLPLTMLVSVRRAVLGKAAGEIARYTFGDGNDDLLRRRVRAFGNFAEYTPMCSIMLASCLHIVQMALVLLVESCVQVPPRTRQPQPTTPTQCAYRRPQRLEAPRLQRIRPTAAPVVQEWCCMHGTTGVTGLASQPF